MQCLTLKSSSKSYACSDSFTSKVTSTKQYHWPVGATPVQTDVMSFGDWSHCKDGRQAS